MNNHKHSIVVFGRLKRAHVVHKQDTQAHRLPGGERQAALHNAAAVVDGGRQERLGRHVDEVKLLIPPVQCISSVVNMLVSTAAQHSCVVHLCTTCPMCCCVDCTSCKNVATSTTLKSSAPGGGIVHLRSGAEGLSAACGRVEQRQPYIRVHLVGLLVLHSIGRHKAEADWRSWRHGESHSRDCKASPFIMKHSWQHSQWMGDLVPAIDNDNEVTTSRSLARMTVTVRTPRKSVMPLVSDRCSLPTCDNSHI
jgi:hypothetical protein